MQVWFLLSSHLFLLNDVLTDNILSLMIYSKSLVWNRRGKNYREGEAQANNDEHDKTACRNKCLLTEKKKSEMFNWLLKSVVQRQNLLLLPSLFIIWELINNIVCKK